MLPSFPAAAKSLCSYWRYQFAVSIEPHKWKSATFITFDQPRIRLVQQAQTLQNQHLCKMRSWEDTVVSGEEEEDDGRVVILPSCSTTRQAELELSIPDSVPSDLRSLRTTRPEEHVMLLGERFLTDEEPDLLSKSTACGQGSNVRITVVIRLGTADQRNIEEQELSRNRRSLFPQWIMFASLLLTLFLVGVTVFLVHDRRQLLAHAQVLEEGLHYIKVAELEQAREAELHRATIAELELQAQALEAELHHCKVVELEQQEAQVRQAELHRTKIAELVLQAQEYKPNRFYQRCYVVR